MALKARRYLKNAESLFIKREYSKALFFYSLALKEQPLHEEATLGALLCDMAGEMEEQAIALFDYYAIIRKENPGDAQKIIKQIIDSLDLALTHISQAINGPMEHTINAMDGITFDEFLLFAQERETMKEAIADLLFSTKVVIQEKDELFSFLELLLENGYEEMALGYMESAGTVFVHDPKMKHLYEKLQKVYIENYAK